MKPYLSLVIPYYNNPESLERLLASIAKSKNVPAFEVIVVDDGSTPQVKLSTGPAARQPQRHPRGDPVGWGSPSRVTRRSIHIVRLPHNRGPAVARNQGVEKAKGKFLVFLDADVEVFPDTLGNIAKIYRQDPDVVALTGVWVKQQRSKAFFPNFKALRDWSYWINERDKSGYYFLFSTRIASIKKSVFVRLGGFDETYPAPLVEDIELTYRIARRYAIIFAPNVRVRHEFESFWPIAKKYFLRAYYWTKLYQKRKKFDPVATTWQEALTTLSGVGVVFFGTVSAFAAFSIPSVAHITYQLTHMVWTKAFLVSLVVHLLLVRTFLTFAAAEKGLVFAAKSFFTGLVLYCFICAGAIAGRIRHG